MVAGITTVDEKGLGVIKGSGYRFYYDTSFTVDETNFVLDIVTDLGRAARDGYIVCDGSGDLHFAISHDGLTYGDTIILKSKEVFNLYPLKVNKIKLIHSGSDSAYRVFVV